MAKTVVSQLTNLLVNHVVSNEGTSRDISDYRLLAILADLSERGFPAWSKKNRTLEYGAILKQIQSVISERRATRSESVKPKGKRRRNYEHSITCQECGILFDASRYDAKYCSAKCRKAQLRKKEDFDRLSSELVSLAEYYWKTYRASIDFNPAPTLESIAKIANSYLKER